MCGCEISSRYCHSSGTVQSCDISIPITPPNVMQWLLRQLEGKEVQKFPTIDQVTERLETVIKVLAIVTMVPRVHVYHELLDYQ